MKKTSSLALMVLLLFSIIPSVPAQEVAAGSISTGMENVDVSTYEGDAVFSMPISLPGRNGFGYGVTLTYNSDVRNSSESNNSASQASWVGLGFTLEAGYVYRDYGSKATGGTDFMIDQSDDSFYVSLPGLSPSKLVVVDTDAFKTTYRTQKDAFAKVESYFDLAGQHIDRWEVTTTDGTTYVFDNKRKTLAYNLERAADGKLIPTMMHKGCTQESDCTETIEYPASADADVMTYRWDLTKILSPDYVDVAPNGLGDEDKGNWVRLEYDVQMRTIQVQNTHILSVDYNCFKEKEDFSAYQHNNADFCTVMGGECLGGEDRCKNSTVLGDWYTSDSGLGHFPCLDSSTRCWIPIDGDEYDGDEWVDELCSYDDSSAAEYFAADYGEATYANTIGPTFICAKEGAGNTLIPAGYLIGDMPRAADAPQGKALPGGKGEMPRSGAMGCKSYAHDLCAGEFGITDPLLLAKCKASAASYCEEQYRENKPGNLFIDPSPSSFYAGYSPEEISPVGNYACGGLSETKKGDWMSITGNACTPQAFGYVSNTAWLGLRDSDHNGVYESDEWAYGTSTYMGLTVPHNTYEYGWEHCVTINAQGLWANREWGCQAQSTTARAICEYQQGSGEEDYTITAAEIPYLDAEEFCSNKGAGWHLVVINTADEQTLVAGLLNTNPLSPADQGLSILREYYNMDDATIGCFNMDPRRGLDYQQTCRGYDIGPAGCDQDSLLQHCCVGEVLTAPTATIGSCLAKLPDDADREGSCQVTTLPAGTCAEEIPVTAYLARITNSAGNRIEFHKSAMIREDYALPAPVEVKFEYCPDEKTTLFSESEHPSPNQEHTLDYIEVFLNDNRVSRIDFEQSYRTQSGLIDATHKKLTLDSITSYGTNDEESLPKMTFTYDAALNDLMIRRVDYPSGGSVIFEYEDKAFVEYSRLVNGQDTRSTDHMCDTIGDENEPVCTLMWYCSWDRAEQDCKFTLYPDEKRVKSKTVCDGFQTDLSDPLHCLKTEYAYGTGVLHVEEKQNERIGYDEVTLIPPGPYGTSTTYYCNDRANCPGMSSSCSTSNNENGKLDAFAFKTELTEEDGTTLVSKNEMFACPKTIFAGGHSTLSTYQTQLLESKTTAYYPEQGTQVTSSTSYEYFDDSETGNGQVKTKRVTNTEGSVLIEQTAWCQNNINCATYSNMPGLEYLLEHHLLSLPHSTQLKDGDGQLLAYSYTAYDDFDNGGDVRIYMAKTVQWEDMDDDHCIDWTDSPCGEPPIQGSDNFIEMRAVEYDEYGNALKTRTTPKAGSGLWYYTTSYYGNDESCSNVGEDYNHALPTCGRNQLGQEVKTSYDEHLNTQRVVDANNQNTLYEYDSFNRLKSVQGPGYDHPGVFTEYWYAEPCENGCGQGISETNPNYVQTSVELDHTSGLSLVTRANTDGLARDYQSQIDKDEIGGVILQTSEYEEGGKLRKRNEVEEMTIPPRRMVDQELSLNGRGAKSVPSAELIKAKVAEKIEQLLLEGKNPYYISDPLPKEGGESEASYIFYEHSALGRPTKVFPLETYTPGDEDYACGKNGKECIMTEYRTCTGTDGLLYECTRVTDPESKTVTTLYDKFARAVEVIDPSGKKTLFAYDLVGNLLEVRDANNIITERNVYNTLGQLVQSQTPEKGIIRYAYDNYGNVLTIIDGKGTTENVFDALSRVTESTHKTLGGAPDYRVSYVYDTCVNGIGRVCSITLSEPYATQITYSYNERGQVVSVSERIGTQPPFVTTYTYDDAGNTKTITVNGVTTTYAYNKMGQLDYLDIDGTGKIFDFGYTKEGLIEDKTYAPYGLALHNEFDGRNRISGTAITRNSQPLLIETYPEYDRAGNLKQITDVMTGKSVAFSYDSLYRLEIVSDSGYYDNTDISYAYDDVGNRQARTVSGNTAYVSSVEDYVYQYETAGQNEGYQLLETDGCTFTYDGTGNMQTKECDGEMTTYSYDANNMLSRISYENNDYLTFAYDPLGRRVKKTVGMDGQTENTWYYYGLGSMPLAEVTGDAT